MPSTQGFRADINGLRAWAVISVILYHFSISGFSGGFIGVDIFFVISGFLMTGIIIRGLEREAETPAARFSILDFYLSRARRILPALLVLVAILLIAGWKFLPSQAFMAQGTHSAAALLFISNIKFWMESGYFDAASHEKLLLHTWSLSVEWQFYLILPLLLVFIWRISPKISSVFYPVLALAIGSFFISVIVTSSDRSAAFYLLPFRSWEMLAGSLAYFASRQIKIGSTMARLLEVTGSLLIIGSMMSFDSNTPWPGWRAIFPVLGTVFLILAQKRGSLLTSHPIAQFFGKTSYSLYLYHWPLAVILIYLGWLDNWLAVMLSLGLTIVLGSLSYIWIELPTRKSLIRLSPQMSLIAMTSVSVVLILTSLAIRSNQGIPGRLSSHTDLIFAEAQNMNPRRPQCHVEGSSPVPECQYGGNELGAVVIGDSHAAAVIRAVERAMERPEKHVLDWTLSSCPTIVGIQDRADTSYRCGEFIESIVNQRLRRIAPTVPILIVNRLSLVFQGPNEDDPNFNYLKEKPYRYISKPSDNWNQVHSSEIAKGFIDTVCKLAETHSVYVLKPIPEMVVNVPAVLGRRALLGDDQRLRVSRDEYRKRQQESLATLESAQQRCGINILDPLPTLCDNKYCYADFEGLPLYYDDDHLSERGADRLIPLFRRLFTQHQTEVLIGYQQSL